MIISYLYHESHVFYKLVKDFLCLGGGNVIVDQSLLLW